MTEGDLKVTLKVDKTKAIVSLLFDGELIDQFATNRPPQPETYMHSLIESIKVVLRDEARVPDLTPIDYV